MSRRNRLANTDTTPFLADIGAASLNYRRRHSEKKKVQAALGAQSLPRVAVRASACQSRMEHLLNFRRRQDEPNNVRRNLRPSGRFGSMMAQLERFSRGLTYTRK